MPGEPGRALPRPGCGEVTPVLKMVPGDLEAAAVCRCLGVPVSLVQLFKILPASGCALLPGSRWGSLRGLDVRPQAPEGGSVS